MGIIELVTFLILIGLVFWAIQTLAPAFNIPAPIVTVVYVLLVVFVVLILLQTLGAGTGSLRLR